MPEYFQICGKKPLSGEIEVRGYKNAATAIIAATLLTDQPCYIKNIPKIEDIFRMLEIVRAMGANVDWQGEREVKIEAKDIDPSKIREDLVTKLRSSILLLGPLLSRFGKVRLPQPGGCLIGARPIDSHLEGIVQMSAKVEKEEGPSYIVSGNLQSTEVVLPEFSVTATENILMAASLLEGKTTIKIAALEPQVKDLCRCLIKMGAKIKWLPEHIIEIEGKKKLNGFSHSLSYDHLEAGTFLILAVATRGKIKVNNTPVESLSAVLNKLKGFGADFEYHFKSPEIADVVVHSPKTLLPVKKVQVLPYPGIPTDLQCAFGVLATQSPGETLIHDPMYEERLKYLKDLNRMGARISQLDPHRAIVDGPSELYGTTIKNYDLRSGAALIIAGLIAEGETLISNIYQVDRGYENIEERLQKIGADIKRVKTEEG
ncbi:UDP-N-acetylglucosamine 1-carboxyvinyltransferase [bacterium]|nr:UDP-N-acetylglucosamine 1-carboxyvinyltransferase [bacterium]